MIIVKKFRKPITEESFVYKKYIKPYEVMEGFPLYDELLELSRNGQPTLLHGKDSYNRELLIGNIHSSNGGDSWCHEYVGKEDRFKDSDRLCEEMEKAIKGKKHERVYELLRDYRDTKRTFRRIDCGNKDSGTVFKELTETTIFTQDEMMNHLSNLNINRPNGFKACFNINPEPPNIFEPHHYEDCGALLRRGVLFIDNLSCNNPKDYEWYNKLAICIEKRRKDDSIYGGWLVAYVDDLEAFPKSVINQFKHISIDSKYYEEKQQEENVQTKERKTQTNTSQEIIPVETTFSYDKTTGKFRLGNKELIAISNVWPAKDVVGSGKDQVEVLVEDKDKDKDSPLYKKTPDDVKWQDLIMDFPNHLEDKVDIFFKGKEKDPVFLKDLGFSDKKATKEFKPLESLILLKRFAKAKNNDIPSPKDVKERKKLYAQVESLRNVLKRCFGLDGDPVPANEEGGYRLLFKAYCYDIKAKEELEELLHSLREYFKGLKKETSETKSCYDNDRILELKQLIETCAEEIVQRSPNTKLEDVICTECYQKIQTYFLNSDNIQILCEQCTPESTKEYKSQSYIEYKDNEIPRSD